MARPVIPITGETGVSYPEARMAATPGRFCEAMVTTNSGRARPTAARHDQIGVTHSGVARRHSITGTCIEPPSAATAMPTANTHGTAKRGKARRPNR